MTTDDCLSSSESTRPPNTRQVPTFFARAWHGFYWHDFIVIQVKIERLPDCSAL
ncbi:hypothetical protein ACEWAL_06325 [Vibrio parahaemolyticus]|nr:hypothetical protein [Vibrio parahaemolyticus]